MKKEELEKIVKDIVEYVWFNQRSLEPWKDQTKTITDKIWNQLPEEARN
jgi:hypothetical protein